MDKTIQDVLDFIDDERERTKEKRDDAIKSAGQNCYAAGMFQGEVDGYDEVERFINGELD